MLSKASGGQKGWAMMLLQGLRSLDVSAMTGQVHAVPQQHSGSPRARINAGFLCFSSQCSGLSHLGQPVRNIWEGAHPLLCSKTLLYCAKASSPGVRLVPVSHKRLRPPEPSPQEGGGKGVWWQTHGSSGPQPCPAQPGQAAGKAARAARAARLQEQTCS